MKFKYVGPHDAVHLVGYGEVKRGEAVSVVGAAADSLSDQADWEHVPNPKPATRASTTSKES